jgi:hypothetical protein
MNNVEEAYEAFAAYLISFIDGREWDVATCTFNVFYKMASGDHQFEKNGIVENKGGFTKNQAAMLDGLDAALYVRDDMLKTTKNRVWRIIFTLYPNGKFNIEYDYNKPEDYEDTDDLISANDLSESLKGLRSS